jgi:hypothetical protein
MIPTAGMCFGAPPGAMCPLELDALSFGMDFNPAGAPALAGRWVFSVDELAVGVPGSPLAPAVWSEGPLGDISADVFESLVMPPVAAPPPPPGFPFNGNSGLIDGNGLASPSGAKYPGLGLIEPRMPFMIVGGDNLDALDLDLPAVMPAAVYFSLDAAFIDPALGAVNTGSAAANGFLPGAILWKPAIGAPPILVYAGPPILGLDLAGPPGSDDLDALTVTENGVAGFQPVPTVATPIPDVVYYSVRRGSAVIGLPDSLFGLPIQPGDILTLPIPGGVSPFPSIFVAAEWLGLATTRTNGVPFGGDDLDALDTRAVPATGLPFCFGDGAPIACACGNNGMPGNGCANSANLAGANLAASGTASLGGDTVVLTATGMTIGSPCIFLQGQAQIPAVAFGDGMRCINVMLLRLNLKFNVGGTASYPVGIEPAVSVQSAALGDVIAPGTTRFYQTYYRDPAIFACPAPATFNVTNAQAIVWMP